MDEEDDAVTGQKLKLQPKDIYEMSSSINLKTLRGRNTDSRPSELLCGGRKYVAGDIKAAFYN